MDTVRRLEQYAVILLFLAFVCAPLAVTWTVRHGTVSMAEQRALAPAPTWPRTAADWHDLPAAISAWYDDHFGLRAPLVRLHTMLSRVTRTGWSAATPVIEGREGFLFFAGDRSLENFQGLAPFSAAELQAWTRQFSDKQRRLAARGIAYLLVLTPNKESVHPQYLPGWLAGAGGTTRADQLLAALRGDPRFPVLDLRPDLRERGRHQILYRRLDTHWNLRGAELARESVARALSAHYPALALAAPRSGHWSERTVADGDLARMLYRHDVETIPTWTPRGDRCRMNVTGVGRTALAGGEPLVDECRPGHLTALVYRDSFMIALRPLLSAHFGRSIYAWERPDPCAMEAMAVARNADVVIEQVTERFLILAPPVCVAPGR